MVTGETRRSDLETDKEISKMGAFHVASGKLTYITMERSTMLSMGKSW
jgi:hypothetical protein